ncbi:major facilitator superfamily transporter [Colletotrichum paranaense]|uniref:Major facilitator superfamily transporter n=1 Tax=Colletotrichum paranaense TaxID=1914294 RepID=A0ABQ9S520_9PEZI|nr:major facilitator superfamily transporter [Colletotrichum paranaense]KAK1526580.1 major facilitator superfamily transporter [Colletotrichum paranaense]
MPETQILEETKNSSSHDVNNHGISVAHSTNLHIDRAKEAKVVRKLDLYITPVLFIVYLSCFIDRANIGNVKVAGMPEEIGATNQQYPPAVSLFVTYVPVEVPAVLLVKRFEPRFVLTVLCVIWSVTTVASGLIRNVGGLCACRLVLGVCEGSLFPSLNIYLTMVYERDEIKKRTSYLVSCMALSGAFGGLLAYGLLQMDGVGAYAGWRWMCLIKGAFGITCAFAVWFELPSDVRKAYFLSDEERVIMDMRHQACNSAVKYFACFVCTIAVYNGTGLNLAWLNVNTAPQYRRATAIEMQQTVGNTAGAVADQIYRSSPYLLVKVSRLVPYLSPSI